MVNQPSEDFLLLAATLFASLPVTPIPIQDQLLLQLHGIFGPMLLSALQLMDRREVVEVHLPGKRSIYQVTSAKGLPYTLYVDLPSLPSTAVEIRGTTHSDPATANPPSELAASPKPLIKHASEAVPNVGDLDVEEEADTTETKGSVAAQSHRDRVYEIAGKMRGMYCPCAGFAYNTLAGERNIFCKHLLAVIIAHMTGKAVQTEVYLKGVVDLLGMNTVAV